MTPEELVEVFTKYAKLGWVVFAVPPEIAAGIVDGPATQRTAAELAARIERLVRLAEAAGVDVS